MSGPESERRKTDRLPGKRLAVTLRPQGWWRRAHGVYCVDFNRYGMSVVGERPLPVGAGVRIDIVARYIHEHGVEGRVVYAQRDDDGWRHGIVFRYADDASAYRVEVDEAMARIEGRLRQLSGP